MTLYQHVSAPIFLTEDLVVSIKDKADYLAIDTTGSLVKTLTHLDLLLWKHVNNIWHCPRENILIKDLDKVCLYNVFQNNIQQIKDTCTVRVEPKIMQSKLPDLPFKSWPLKPLRWSKIVDMVDPRSPSTSKGWLYSTWIRTAPSLVMVSLTKFWNFAVTVNLKINGR